MMTCRTATHLHTEADEGTLTGFRKLAYGFHLTVCGPCKRYRAQLRTTAEALHEMPKEQPPEGLLDLLSAEIEKKNDGA